MTTTENYSRVKNHLMLPTLVESACCMTNSFKGTGTKRNDDAWFGVNSCRLNCSPHRSFRFSLFARTLIAISPAALDLKTEMRTLAEFRLAPQTAARPKLGIKAKIQWPHYLGTSFKNNQLAYVCIYIGSCADPASPTMQSVTCSCAQTIAATFKESINRYTCG